LRSFIENRYAESDIFMGGFVSYLLADVNQRLLFVRNFRAFTRRRLYTYEYLCLFFGDHTSPTRHGWLSSSGASPRRSRQTSFNFSTLMMRFMGSYILWRYNILCAVYDSQFGGDIPVFSFMIGHFSTLERFKNRPVMVFVLVNSIFESR